MNFKLTFLAYLITQQCVQTSLFIDEFDMNWTMKPTRSTFAKIKNPNTLMANQKFYYGYLVYDAFIKKVQEDERNKVLQLLKERRQRIETQANISNQYLISQVRGSKAVFKDFFAFRY